MKKCYICKQILLFSEFNKDKYASDNLQGSCRKCQSIYRKLYFRKNREREAAQQKINKAFRKKEISLVRKKYYEKNKSKELAALAKYQKENPEKVNALNALRRAAKNKATPKWLTKEQKDQMKSFYAEANRLSKQTGILHHVDHIFPLIAVNDKNIRNGSGLHVPWNLQILTGSQNSVKGNKLF